MTCSHCGSKLVYDKDMKVYSCQADECPFADVAIEPKSNPQVLGKVRGGRQYEIEGEK